MDATFNISVDEDFDYRHSGITRNNFCNVYLDWIQHCVQRRLYGNVNNNPPSVPAEGAHGPAGTPATTGGATAPASIGLASATAMAPASAAATSSGGPGFQTPISQGASFSAAFGGIATVSTGSWSTTGTPRGDVPRGGSVGAGAAAVVSSEGTPRSGVAELSCGGTPRNDAAVLGDASTPGGVAGAAAGATSTSQRSALPPPPPPMTSAATQSQEPVEELDDSPGSALVSLCFALSLLGRRALNAASHNAIACEFY